MAKSTKTQWEKQLVSPEEVLFSIKPGMTIFLGRGVAEPRTLMKYVIDSGTFFPDTPDYQIQTDPY